ncbi:hypothetical protein BLNAU_14235 [Blattamonas nauphoetae]|uniref:Uncharacterized protein n=1 Tax=Blattamonas nauphoetae TaxID=2049346 RepID=A0ABQ9XJP1_9EUKA|nr:hypothetical protein BLNAU_14235 [Blattamonas nauphoetae]
MNLTSKVTRLSCRYSSSFRFIPSKLFQLMVDFTTSRPLSSVMSLFSRCSSTSSMPSLLSNRRTIPHGSCISPFNLIQGRFLMLVSTDKPRDGMSCSKKVNALGIVRHMGRLRASSIVDG